MKSLFIIGNGFDLSHGLETKYEDFHKYLQTQYQDANGETFIQPEVSMMPKGGEECDDTSAVSFLMRIISATSGDEWNDIETTLGILDFGEWLAIDYKSEEDNPWNIVRRNEDIALNLKVAALKISEYFSDWINTIEINKKVTIKRDFANLIDKDNDLFLSFNYTKTLEILYRAKAVCHIHGKQGENLLFGHGNDKDDYEENMAKYMGAEHILQEIHDSLRKNTANAIIKNRKFFDSISHVGKIYSYGFSFSDVDKIYIEQICKQLSSSKVTWYLNRRDSSYQRTIRACGYKGEFSTYLIEK